MAYGLTGTTPQENGCAIYCARLLLRNDKPYLFDSTANAFECDAREVLSYPICEVPYLGLEAAGRAHGALGPGGSARMIGNQAGRGCGASVARAIARRRPGALGATAGGTTV